MKVFELVKYTIKMILSLVGITLDIVSCVCIFLLCISSNPTYALIYNIKISIVLIIGFILGTSLYIVSSMIKIR